MNKTSIASIATLLVFCMGLPVSAAILFTEDFSSGAIGADWTQGTAEQAAPVRYNHITCMNLGDLIDVPGVDDQTPCSSGDYGWVSGSATFNAFDTWIRSTAGYARADDIVIEFTTIGARHRAGTGLPFPGNSALNGPGHNTSDGAVGINTDVEGGMVGTYGSMTWGDGAGSANATVIGADMNRDPNADNNPGRWWNQLEWADTTPAAKKATNALTHRVQFGTTQGFVYEYKRADEATWTQLEENNGTVTDYTDDVAMDTRLSGGGTSAMIYLGWCANQGAVIIDDIVVNDGGLIPVEVSGFAID